MILRNDHSKSLYSRSDLDTNVFVCFVLKEEAWAAGGSGILLKTRNGGKSWNRDKAADNIAANLYAVK